MSISRKHILLGVVSAIGIIGSAGVANASSRSIPGVNIVTRAQWGADESMKYTSREEYQNMIRQAEEREKYMTELEHARAEEEAEKSRVSRAYALENFPNDILLDMVVDSENGNSLRWKKEYVFNKTKILVHHTVNDLSKFHSEESVKSLLRSVYKMHAFTNGRGDIGYNFVISPNGVIYEGRSGGEGIVGAHATRNNQPSVGIALIGNFEVDKPTDAQIEALIKLSTALAAKYKIDPSSMIDYHRKTSSAPYVSTFQNYSLASHRDVGATSCPGENLYDLLPAIRDRVKIGIANYVATYPSIKTPTQDMINASNADLTTGSNRRPTIPTVSQTTPSLTQTHLTLTPAVGLTSDVYLARTRTSNMRTTLPKCQLLQGNVTIAGCMYKDGELIVGIKKKPGVMSPGTVRVKASSRTAQVTFDVYMSWQEKVATKPSMPTIRRPVTATQTTTPRPAVVTSTPSGADTAIIEERKKNFSITIPRGMTKIVRSVDASQGPVLMNRDVSVLLYNASMLSSSWTFVCVGTCQMAGAPFTTITVTSSGGMLAVQKNGLVWKEASLNLTSTENSTITVMDSVSRKQYGIYRGNISIQIQNIKKLNGNYTSQYGIINTLPMRYYLAGMAEASDKEPLEKTKVLALLTKAYALYYIGGSGPHPSIPQGAAYQAIDDPRFFQKYVGVTWERASKNRPTAIAETSNQYIVYNDTLPILPYFHCSPGFTRAAREKWGRIDTPYLQSVLDDSGCTTFEGHGVGLSGQGATKKAKNGEKTEDIIKYYYKGVEVKTLY